MQFDWDEANEAHIARHGVSRIETEQALVDPLAKIFDSTVEDEEVRYRQVGATSRGRLLVVVYTMRNQAARPITAYDADSYTAKSYRRGTKF